MKTFHDTAGRPWQVQINVAAVKRVREALNVNLLELADSEGQLLGRLLDDPVLLCDVLWVVCRPQAEQLKVTDEDFGRALGGDVLDAATDALLEELVDFFPKGRREVLARILQKTRSFLAKGLAMAAARLDDPRLDHEIETQLSRQIDSALTDGTDSAGSLPDSAASNPTGTP